MTPIDAESAVIEYLSDVVVAGVPVSGHLPRGWKKGDTAVRVTRVGGTTTTIPGHIDRPNIQIETFHIDDPSAAELAGAVLAALYVMADTSFDTYVVTGIDPSLGIRRVPDPDTGASRYVFAVILYVHAAPV